MKRGIRIPEDYERGGSDFLAATRVWQGQKRLHEIIDAFLLADLDSTLYVAGETNLKAKDSRIKMLGLLSQKELRRYQSACRTLISIVWLDCMPNSVCEFLCSGGNVVTTSASGTAEIVDKKLVLSEKPWDFRPCDQNRPPKIDVEALATLLRKSVSMPPQGCSHVHIDTIAAQYKAFFEELLGG